MGSLDFIFKLRKVLFVLAFIGSISFAGDTASLSAALDMLCTLFYQLLPMAVLVIVTLAGVVFAVGQTMGAETRARANVWATNLLIGGIIAGAVTIIAPAVVSYLVGTIDLSATCSNSGAGGVGGGGGSGTTTG